MEAIMKEIAFVRSEAQNVDRFKRFPKALFFD